MIGKAISYFGIRGLILGLVLGGTYGTILAFFIGTLYGAAWGAIVGLFVGLPGGLIIGCIRQRWFIPVANVSTYRWTLRIVGFVIAFTGTFIGMSLFFGNDVRDWLSADVFAYLHIPALIAAIAGIIVSDDYAKHHVADDIQFELFSKAKAKHH